MTAVVSLLVATVAVCAPAVAGLVIPRSVIRTSSPALIDCPENSPQVTIRPEFGLLQNPTSTARVTSRTVAPCQLAVVVPPGSVTVIVSVPDRATPTVKPTL